MLNDTCEMIFCTCDYCNLHYLGFIIIDCNKGVYDPTWMTFFDIYLLSVKFSASTHALQSKIII